MVDLVMGKPKERMEVAWDGVIVQQFRDLDDKFKELLKVSVERFLHREHFVSRAKF